MRYCFVVLVLLHSVCLRADQSARLASTVQLIEKIPLAFQVALASPVPASPRASAVSVAVSLQPPEVFKGAFLERVPGVALYDALVCNNTAKAVKINGGKVLQAIHPRAIAISPRLYALTAMRAKGQNWKHKAAKVGYWAAWGATIVISSGAVTVGSDLLRLIPPLAAQGAERLAREWEGEGLDPTVIAAEFLTSETEILLDGAACRALPFLGRSRPGFQDFEVGIE